MFRKFYSLLSILELNNYTTVMESRSVSITDEWIKVMWYTHTHHPPPMEYYTHPQWNTAAAAAKSLQSCPTLRPCRRQPTRLPDPWDSPGKNTGVGCHFLLQCVEVKSESEVAQSCPTLRDPMDCSPPGSSVHGIFQARVLEWGATAFSKWNTTQP